MSRSAYMTFPLAQESKSVLGLNQCDDVRFLSWTTQPWTIPGNKALGFAENTKYCVAKETDNSCENDVQIFYVMAVDCIGEVSGRTGLQFEIVKTFESTLLDGCSYHHPMDPSITGRLTAAEHVTTSVGTGVVHLAPGHGAEDFAIAKRLNLATESIVDRDGCLNSNAGFGLEGKFIFTEGNEAVINQLDSSGNLVYQHNYKHSYPCDWRTKAPIIIRASKQWFIETSSFSEQARNACDQIKFYPESGKRSMLSHLSQRDFWCISRQRAWGLPIPTFYCRSSGEPVVTESSIEHLSKLFGEYGSDVWWNYPISDLLPDHVIEKSGLPGTCSDYTKGEDILDIWFDSGVSWAAVLGEDSSVADMYLEGRDQYNGWFYSSLMTHFAFGKKEPPFKSLYTHGFTLAGDGQKMSKSIGNVVDPVLLTQGGKDLVKNPAYGVDVLRWWVAESNTFKDVRISNEIMDSMKQNVQKIRSSLRFIISNLNDFQPTTLEVKTLKPVDAYYLKQLISHSYQVTQHMNEYKFSHAVQLIINIVQDLSRNYFAIVKDRLYCDGKNWEGRISAQQVLYHICGILMKSIAPILPHLVEEVHMHHPCVSDDKSDAYFRNGWIDVKIFENLNFNQENIDVVSKLLALRSKLTSIDSCPRSDYDVTISTTCQDYYQLLTQFHENEQGSDVREILGCSQCRIIKEKVATRNTEDHMVITDDDDIVEMTVMPAAMKPCPRCRLNTSEKAGQLCDRCLMVLSDPWDAETTLFSN